jgi:hypothetical protein
MMKLVIEIEFGNEAMQTYAEAREAILELRTPRHNPEKGDSGKLRDLNGNTVGTWRVK